VQLDSTGVLRAFALVALCGCGRVDFSVLTYNVAGLPDVATTRTPAEDNPRIGPLLDDFDIVLLQEDFAYHASIAAAVTLPYALPAPGADPVSNVEIPSGLSRFSRFAIDEVVATRWDVCHGLTDSSSDCMAPKGFAVAEHHIAVGGATVSLDVYDLHMDAGGGEGDRAARAAQVDQLVAALGSRSPYRAVIVAGDTNMDEADPDLLERLLREGELEDACAALECPEPERIDRVLYRGARWVELVPRRWYLPDGFVDDEGRALSDHQAVAVDFTIAPRAPGGSGDMASFFP
jgi:endonuclease/exonuclease/phosphatase family metal-dependent hydrolase